MFCVNLNRVYKNNLNELPCKWGYSLKCFSRLFRDSVCLIERNFINAAKFQEWLFNIYATLLL